jgi:hypothetical protein
MVLRIKRQDTNGFGDAVSANGFRTEASYQTHDEAADDRHEHHRHAEVMLGGR